MTTLEVDVTGRVATVTLDAPSRRNALDLPMVAEIVAAFDALEARPDVGAIVLTGRPPAFCAGADLSHLGGTEEEGLRRIYEGFLRVGRSRLPTIAAVNGPAIGAGVNLALVCDLRLVAPEARFDARFLDLGLHPGGGHTWMLRRLVGPETASALLLFGAVLDGAAAVERGLAWDLVPSSRLLDEARLLAGRAAANPRDLVCRAKATLVGIEEVDHHAEAVERELAPQVWSLRQPEFAERLAALKAKIAGRGNE